MNVLGYDIYLDVKLLSFDRSDVVQKKAIILEQAKELPTEIDSFFMEEEKVPCGGFVQILVQANRSTGSARTILSEVRKIPSKTWWSRVGNFYNNTQETLRHIPWVGKPLEKLAPDAYQRIKLHYYISIAEEKYMSYWLHLNCSNNTNLLVFQGKILLG